MKFKFLMEGKESDSTNSELPDDIWAHIYVINDDFFYSPPDWNAKNDTSLVPVPVEWLPEITKQWNEYLNKEAEELLGPNEYKYSLYGDSDDGTDVKTLAQNFKRNHKPQVKVNVQEKSQGSRNGSTKIFNPSSMKLIAKLIAELCVEEVLKEDYYLRTDDTYMKGANPYYTMINGDELIMSQDYEEEDIRYIPDEIPQVYVFSDRSSSFQGDPNTFNWLKLQREKEFEEYFRELASSDEYADFQLSLPDSHILYHSNAVYSDEDTALRYGNGRKDITTTVIDDIKNFVEQDNPDGFSNVIIFTDSDMSEASHEVEINGTVTIIMFARREYDDTPNLTLRKYIHGSLGKSKDIQVFLDGETVSSWKKD